LIPDQLRLLLSVLPPELDCMCGDDHQTPASNGRV
jgi:hypothetical protein